MAKLMDYTTDGVDYAINVGENGEFWTTTNTGDDDRTLRASTLDLLKKKISNLQRRKTIKLALPATIAKSRRWDSEEAGDLVDVVVTGIHQRNRQVLYRNPVSNKAGDVDHKDTLFVRLSPTLQEQFKDLCKALMVAKAAKEKFITRYKYNDDTIKEHVRAAEAKAGIEPEK